MKLKIELFSDTPVVLPIGFSEFFQALIYNHLEIDSRRWLHEFAYSFEKRKFRLFVFSTILERGRFNSFKKEFIFPQTISFYIASPVDWILEQLAQNFIQSENVILGKNSLKVSSISVMDQAQIESEKIKVKTNSPIEVHSTFTLENGRKKTHYYTPFEKDFSELVNNNLKKKWTSLYEKECDYNVQIRPLFNGSNNEKIIYFGTKERKTLIKGWKGWFELKGDREMLRFALDAGLGSKNSQGFGMVEVIEEKRR